MMQKYELQLTEYQNKEYIKKIFNQRYYDLITVVIVVDEMNDWLKSNSMPVSITCTHGPLSKDDVLMESYIDYTETKNLLDYVHEDFDVGFRIDKFTFDSEEDRNVFKLTWG